MTTQPDPSRKVDVLEPEWIGAELVRVRSNPYDGPVAREIVARTVVEAIAAEWAAVEAMPSAGHWGMDYGNAKTRAYDRWGRACTALVEKP